MLKFRPEIDEATKYRADKAYHKANALWYRAETLHAEVTKKIWAFLTNTLWTNEKKELWEKREILNSLTKYYIWYMEGIRDISYEGRSPHESLLEIAALGDASHPQWYSAIGYHDAYFFDHYTIEEEWARKLHGDLETRKKRIAPPISGDSELDSFEYY